MINIILHLMEVNEMDYRLKSGFIESVFEDDGFRVGKKHYDYSEITSVKQTSSLGKLINATMEIKLGDKVEVIGYDKKTKEAGEAVFAFLEEYVANNVSIDESYEKAKTLYNSCMENGFGSGFNEKWGIKHFKIITDNMMEDEEVIFPFIGLHNFISVSNHDSNYAYAVTNKRILMGQKTVLGENFQSVNWDNINDISFTAGPLFGKVTIDTFKEVFNVGLDKDSAKKINNKIHDVFESVKKQKDVQDALQSENQTDPYEEIKKLKELFDMEIITQEEFDNKKRELLGV